MKRQRKGYRARGAKRSNSHRTAQRVRPGLGFEQLEPRLAMAVVINEFLADNESGLTDFAGEQQDWIELKNTGAVAENIGGWYLTDDSLNLTKWQIPAGTTIAAGQHLVIFASSKNLTGAELHTNFGLSNNGEDLALVMPNGVTIADAYLDFPAQMTDVSYGIGKNPAAAVSEFLIGDQADAAVYPFSTPNAAVDDHWLDIGYDDNVAGWIHTKTGVGFDRDSSPNNGLDALIFQELTTGQMPNSQVSAYVRVPFNVTNKEQLTALEMELRYDDGYVLWLNGREVKRVNINTQYKLGENWELNSRGNRPDSTVIDTPDVIDLSAWLDTLVEGENVIGIYGANHTSQNTDFLIDPLLRSTRAVGDMDHQFMVGPTPGAANGAGWEGIVGDTMFSHDRGFYDAAFALAISTVTPDATIRYTLDGTVPTLTNGLTYSGAIAIDPATIPDGNRGVVTVRAAAFKSGFVETNVDTQSYVFLDKVIRQDGSGLPAFTTWGSPPDWSMDPVIRAALGDAQLKSDLQSIPSMSLVVDWEEFFGDGTNHGIYTETATWRDSSDERASSLEYFTSDGSEQFQSDAAVEIQGHSSTTRWNTDKLSLQVKFKQPYDTKLESGTLFGNSVVDGTGAANEFDTFILDAQFNYTWLHGNTQQNGVAKYINDQAVSDFINAAGGNAPHGRWVNLYINGVYWGIYNAHERPDEAFAAEYYGGDEDDYFVVKAYDGNTQHPAQYLQVEGGLAAEAAYATLIDEAGDNLANNTEYAQVAELLDVDEFVDYMIIHYYAGNWDWGQDNWYATFNHVAEDGLWRFHAWDQEHAWPTDDNAALGENNFGEDYNSTTKNDAFGPTGLQHRLMLNENYRLKFADRVQELMYNGGLLTPSEAAALFQTRANELDRAIAAESARWGDNRISSSGQRYDRAEWLVNIAGLMTDFFPVRTNLVLGHFNSASGVKTDWIPSLAAPQFSQYGGAIIAGFDLTLTKPAGSPGGAIIYYTLDGSDPRLANGTLNPAAVTYSTPIDLTESTNVKARIFFNNSGTADDWSPLEDRNFSVAEDPIMGLRIVELMYNPPGSSDDTEYFEILNTGTQTADLTGVQITEFSAGGYTFAGGSLAAGQRIVVVKSQTAFAAAFPGVTNVAAGEFSGSLSNEGEFVALRGPGPASVLIQSFTYGDRNVSGWPADADGEGKSLVYTGPFDANEDPTSGSPGDPYDNSTQWQASTQLGGSPGSDGAESSIPGDYDGNGTVETPDYEKWKTDFGMVVTAGTGSDGNGNGVVDTGDYTVWRDNLGATAPAAGAGGGGAVALASKADDEKVSEEPALLGYPFVSSALVIDRMTVTSEMSQIAATAVDANLLVWRSNTDGEEDSAVVDELAATSNETEAIDLAVLWEDDMWLKRLGVS